MSGGTKTDTRDAEKRQKSQTKEEDLDTLHQQLR